RPLLLRRRAGRPQLTRDPLGFTRSPGVQPESSIMRRLASSIAIVFLCARTAEAQDIVALRSATVIDGTSASPRERTTILIRGEGIVAVGPDGRVPIPPQATVLDATGRWVIPGLVRSEERRVGKECSARRGWEQLERE